jgi:hypothetical protein
MDDTLVEEVLAKVYDPVFGKRERSLQFLSSIRRALSGESLLILCPGGSSCGGSTIGNFILDTFGPIAKPRSYGLFGTRAPDKFAMKSMEGAKLLVFNHVDTTTFGPKLNNRFLNAVGASLLVMCNRDRIPTGDAGRETVVIEMPNKFENTGALDFCRREDVIAANVRLVLEAVDV